MSPKAKIFTIVTVLSLVLDQLSKWWVNTNLEMFYTSRQMVTIIPNFFEIIHAENPGAAFSLFATLPYRQYLFFVFAVIAIVVIGKQLKELPRDTRLLPAALGLIIGGALGNAIDRLYKGTVTDFLRVHVEFQPVSGWLDSLFGVHEYPTFNIADSTLLVGILIAVFWPMPAAEEAAAEPAPTSGHDDTPASASSPT